MYAACEDPAQTGADEPDLPNVPFELTKSQEEFVEDARWSRSQCLAELALDVLDSFRKLVLSDECDDVGDAESAVGLVLTLLTLLS